MDLVANRKEFISYLTNVRGRSNSTGRAYAYDLSRFSSYLLSRGVAGPKDVTTRHIEMYLGELGVSATTRARTRSSISAFFAYLSKQEIVSNNPCDRLESIKLIEKEPQFLSQAQYQSLINAAKNTTSYYRARDVALINLLLKTGLRRSEAVGLDIEDVDLDRGTLSTIRKGGGRQTLPLHAELNHDLSEYLLSRGAAVGPLFISRYGTRLSSSELNHIVKKYAKEAGLGVSVSCHTLRHSYASALLSQNVQVSYIQKLMNHKQLSTTARYLHFQDEQVRVALDGVTF